MTSTKSSALDQITEGSVWQGRGEHGGKYAKVSKNGDKGNEYAEITVNERTGSPGRFSTKPIVYTAKRFITVFEFRGAK